MLPHCLADDRPLEQRVALVARLRPHGWQPVTSHEALAHLVVDRRRGRPRGGSERGGELRRGQLLKARGRQRTGSTHVLAAVRALNRLAVIGERLRHALDSMAVAAADWLRPRCRPGGQERYGRRLEDADLPQGQAAREAFALQVGGDGHASLADTRLTDAPIRLRGLPVVATPRRVGVQQFRLDEGAVRWRAADAIPPAAVFIGSPYDEGAHYARKATTSWGGYKIHTTGACDDGMPRLITHVETTTAPVVDAAALPAIHQALHGRALLPAVQFVDSGYRGAFQIVAAHIDYAVALRGPARPDYRCPARAQNGFALGDTQLDWEQEQATCPAGRTSISWRQRPDPAGRPLSWVKSSSKDCWPHRSPTEIGKQAPYHPPAHTQTGQSQFRRRYPRGLIVEFTDHGAPADLDLRPT